MRAGAARGGGRHQRRPRGVEPVRGGAHASTGAADARAAHASTGVTVAHAAHASTGAAGARASQASTGVTGARAAWWPWHRGPACAASVGAARRPLRGVPEGLAWAQWSS